MLLSTERLVVGYDGQPLLPPVDLEVRAGEIWAFCGHNGGGKSTMLRSLLGLQRVVGGSVTWAAGARLAFVDQRVELNATLPSRVVDFVRGGADQGWSFLRPRLPRERRETVARAMADCDVARLARMPVAHLSEGQRQRVLFARALASGPSVLILDEPTSAMDPRNERASFDLLGRLRETRGLTILLASHEMRLLTDLATHGVLIDKDDDLVRVAPLDELVATPQWRDRYGASAGEGAR